MSVPTSDPADGTIRQLEHLALNAWPALQVMVQDDWILRFAGGYTKRANSVNALAPACDTSIAALQRRIANAESHYARQSIRCVFRVTPLMDPRVDTLLEARGWTAYEESLVMVAALDEAPAPPPRIEIAPRRARAWSAHYMEFSDVPPERQAIHDRIVDAIVPETGLATALDEHGTPAAIGLGVVERGHIGLADIVSDPGRRRAGHGRRLVEGLLAWGRGRGATSAWLQVVASNERAVALYRQLGFREAYRYHYRAEPA